MDSKKPPVSKQAKSKPSKALNADNLKTALWETLNEIRAGETDPKTANAIAAQARGIISTVNVELNIQNSVNKLTKNVRKFTE